MLQKLSKKTAIVFNSWISDNLLPVIAQIRQVYLNRNINIIMDNVSYHKSTKTKELLELNSINLVFQPPYSPDPIEPSWDATKNDVRLQSYVQVIFSQKLDNSLAAKTWSY